MSHELPSPTRRSWLLHTLQAGVTVTLGAIFYPVVRFLWPRPATSSGGLQVVAPYRVNQLKADAAGHWPAPFEFGGKPCLLIRTSEGDIRAFNAVCTHVECTAEFSPEKSAIICNCHNGTYDLHGRNVSGPPPRPLEAYKVTLGAGNPGEEEIIVSRATT